VYFVLTFYGLCKAMITAISTGKITYFVKEMKNVGKTCW